MFTSRFLAAAMLTATLVVPAAAFAQQAPAAPNPAMSPMPGQHHGHRGGWRRMVQTLNLSAAQKSQIDAAFAQAKASNQNVTDPAARQANRAKLHAQIEAILTPAQRTQLQAEMQKAHQRHTEGNGPDRDGHGPDRDGHGPMPVPSASPRP